MDETTGAESRCDCASRQRLSVSTAGEMTLRRCRLQEVLSPLLSPLQAFKRCCYRDCARQSTREREYSTPPILDDNTIHGIEAPKAAARCYTASPGKHVPAHGTMQRSMCASVGVVVVVVTEWSVISTTSLYTC